MGMMDEVRAGKDLYATFDTTEGAIVVKLFTREAPKTVENFVGLATGEKPWKDPASGEDRAGVPLYDGTIFHRCIKDFMVQGGDPLGRGTGGPGYKFEDEFKSGKTFNKPGLLAMANSWPNNKHTIFGEVVQGYEHVARIANVIPKGAGDRPKTDVKINKLTIST